MNNPYGYNTLPIAAQLSNCAANLSTENLIFPTSYSQNIGSNDPVKIPGCTAAENKIANTCGRQTDDCDIEKMPPTCKGAKNLLKCMDGCPQCSIDYFLANTPCIKDGGTCKDHTFCLSDNCKNGKCIAAPSGGDKVSGPKNCPDSGIVICKVGESCEETGLKEGEKEPLQRWMLESNYHCCYSSL